MFLNCFKLSHANGDGEEKMASNFLLWGRNIKPTEKNSSIFFSRWAKDAGQEQNVVIFLTITSEKKVPSKYETYSYFLLWRAKGLAKEWNVVLFLTLEGERLGHRTKCRRISYCGGRKVRPDGQVHSGGGCVTHAFSSNFLNTSIELSMTTKKIIFPSRTFKYLVLNGSYTLFEWLKEYWCNFNYKYWIMYL